VHFSIRNPQKWYVEQQRAAAKTGRSSEPRQRQTGAIERPHQRQTEAVSRAKDISYLTDTNLDGAIDEQDLSVSYDFNFAVLNSEGTFSSANAMASILSDRGIPVLGEQSGGGSCSVQYCSTADGWLYTISNNIHLVNQAGEDIDSGVPVKENLVTEAADGSRDYSKFYNLDDIRKCFGEAG